jgi:hypothetical protein
VLHTPRVEIADRRDPRRIELADVGDIVSARNATDADGAPTLMRLVGDVAPKTDAGTMAGNPVATDAAAAVLPAADRNERRVCLRTRVCAMSLSYRRSKDQESCFLNKFS